MRRAIITITAGHLRLSGCAINITKMNTFLYEKSGETKNKNKYTLSNKNKKQDNMPKLSEVFTGGFLKAEDLKGKAVKVTISEVEVKQFDDGKKVLIHFEGKDKALVANKTNCSIIEEVLGSDDTDDWIGKQVTLITKKVEFKGDLVPAIRVKLEDAPAKEEESGDPDW